jgi:hypothetical protein
LACDSFDIGRKIRTRVLDGIFRIHLGGQPLDHLHCGCERIRVRSPVSHLGLCPSVKILQLRPGSRGIHRLAKRIRILIFLVHEEYVPLREF